MIDPVVVFAAMAGVELGVILVLVAMLAKLARSHTSHVERISVLMRAGSAGEGIAAVERLARLEEARATLGSGAKPAVRGADQVAPAKPSMLTRVWRRNPPKATKE